MAVFCRGDADSNNVPEMRLTCAAAYPRIQALRQLYCKKGRSWCRGVAQLASAHGLGP